MVPSACRFPCRHSAVLPQQSRLVSAGRACSLGMAIHRGERLRLGMAKIEPQDVPEGLRVQWSPWLRQTVRTLKVVTWLIFVSSTALFFYFVVETLRRVCQRTPTHLQSGRPRQKAASKLSTSHSCSLSSSGPTFRHTTSAHRSPVAQR